MQVLFSISQATSGDWHSQLCSQVEFRDVPSHLTWKRKNALSKWWEGIGYPFLVVVKGKPLAGKSTNANPVEWPESCTTLKIRLKPLLVGIYRMMIGVLSRWFSRFSSRTGPENQRAARFWGSSRGSDRREGFQDPDPPLDQRGFGVECVLNTWPSGPKPIGVVARLRIQTLHWKIQKGFWGLKTWPLGPKSHRIGHPWVVALRIKMAEADAESKRLSGVGMANMRAAMAQGYQDGLFG